MTSSEKNTNISQNNKCTGSPQSRVNTSERAPYRAFTTAQMTLTAIMAAVLCILGPLSIPIPVSPVPITLTNLAIYFSVCILGWKLGTVSYLIYLAIGLVGLPVFSSFGSGFGKLLGPTGGYLIGFIFMSFVSGAGAWLSRQLRLRHGVARGAGQPYFLPSSLGRSHPIPAGRSDQNTSGGLACSGTAAKGFPWNRDTCCLKTLQF